METILKKVGYRFILKSISLPIIFITCLYCTYTLYQIVIPVYFPIYEKYDTAVNVSYDVILVIGLYWFLRNLMNASKVLLLRWSIEKNHPFISLIYPILVSCLKGIFLLFMINMIILLLNLHGEIATYIDKAIKIFFILFVANITFQIITCLEKYIVDKYIEKNEDIQNSRKLRTQVVLLKKIVAFLIVAFSFIAITMLFDSIKSFGVSLLTTAGIVSAVLAFASQQSLARLFAGLQLAFTQPLRIGDTVVIDNELGQVEEISLSFITIKLWDLRRLIIPTDYFTNKGLVNLTAESSELIGTVYFYADYTLPIDDVREHFKGILDQSAYWNKQSYSLDITDFKHNSMEFRCLVSADDASNLWKLRCEIREKLMNYIVKTYPECLTKSRSLSVNPQSLMQTESS